MSSKSQRFEKLLEASALTNLVIAGMLSEYLRVQEIISTEEYHKTGDLLNHIADSLEKEDPQ